MESDDVGRAVFPHYYVSASYGRWQMSLHLKSRSEKLFQRVLPLLQEAHPEQWGKPAK